MVHSHYKLQATLTGSVHHDWDLSRTSKAQITAIQGYIGNKVFFKVVVMQMCYGVVFPTLSEYATNPDLPEFRQEMPKS